MVKINLGKKEKYLLACSYGPDSMALFGLLLKNGYNFEVAHVNYGLRKEADEETKNLISFCEKNNIRIHVYRNLKSIENNIEEKCREIRYSFFKKTILENKLDALLVAHNQDDNIETYFLQKKRHNIVECFGLERVSEINGYCVIRPLLNFSKEELLTYCRKNNIPFAIDSSNLEDKFERNKIRHQIVQKMDQEGRYKTLIEIEKANMTLYKKRILILREMPTLIVDLIKYDDEDLAYYFTQICRKYFSDFELSLKRVKEFRKIMLSDKPNVVLKLKDDMHFVKSYDRAEIKLLPPDTSFYFVINEPCKFDCEFFFLDFRGDTKNRNVKNKDYPLIIRNASKFDEVLIKDYFVSMRRQFINWKMPKELRGRWPIILNNKGDIIYVPKYTPDFKVESTTNFYVKI